MIGGTAGQHPADQDMAPWTAGAASLPHFRQRCLGLWGGGLRQMCPTHLPSTAFIARSPELVLCQIHFAQLSPSLIPSEFQTRGARNLMGKSGRCWAP